ncbi:MAG TPA: nitroreductase family protein [Anaerolineales bacterium]|nr:nitroreductase family protein [Anaerolineales bacterium]
MNKPADSSQIHPLIANRWSPRAFAETPLTLEILHTLVEAGRWAASAGNTQPWRFVLAPKDSAYYAPLFASLDEGNQAWVQYVPALMLVVAQIHNGKRRLGHAWFDCGWAVGSLSLQAEALGLRVHPMAGFSANQLRTTLEIPDSFEPVVMLAVGYPTSDLSHLSESNQTREQAPRTRKPIEQLIYAGDWA